MKRLFPLMVATVFLLAAALSAQQLKLEIPNPTPVEADLFGAAVAAYGNYFVVGAPGADLEAPDAGMAYLMTTDANGDFAIIYTFQNPEPDSGDNFGASVAFYGNHILIGAPGDDGSATDAGAAYLFDATTGELIRKFENPSAFEGDHFGHAVATNDGHFLIGAPHAISPITGATRAGVAYLYDSINSQPLITLFKPDPVEGDLFGWSLAFVEENAIVGAPSDDGIVPDGGAAYLFDFTGALLNTFTSPLSTSADSSTANFGVSVASVGKDLAIGAPLDSHPISNAPGAAYLYDGATYELRHALGRPTPTADYFGLTVAGFGCNLLVGAPWEHFDEQVDAGAVYLFDGISGNLLAQFTKPYPEAGDMLGLSIAAVGHCILAGAPGNDTGAVDAGAAYLFIPAHERLTRIELPALIGLPEDIVEIPITVSSDSSFGFAQFVVDYDGSVLKFVEAQVGNATQGFTLLKRESLPFPPSNPGTDRNLLVQISSPTLSFIGEAQEVVVLKMRVIGALGQMSPLAFDVATDRTTLTTVSGIDLNNGYLEIVNGRLTVGNLFNISGTVGYLESWQPVPGADIALTGSEFTFNAWTNEYGQYAFADIPPDSVQLIPSKAGDLGNSITGADALKTLRAVAFLDSLSNAQALAADVDLTGEVSGADALSILRYLAFFPRNTAYTGAWLFWPYESSFVLNADTTVDFGAVVLGDVNLNWVSSIGGVEGSAPANRVAALNASSVTAAAEVRLPEISLQSLPADQIIEIPIIVSTDSMLGFAQVVVDYDGAVLEFVDARIGADAAGFSLQINSNLPFAPTAQNTNKNVLAQISNINNTITGNARQAVVLRMKVLNTNSGSLLAIDPAPNHTLLTTVNNTDLRGNALSMVNGRVGTVTAVEEEAGNLAAPQDFNLEQNYPNPFNPETTIQYAIPAQSRTGGTGRTRVSLQIFNMQGQLVRTLVNDEQTPGRYRVVWNGRNDTGAKVSSGVYVYTLTAGDYKATKKLSALK